jgi:hypothetical protein
LATRRTGGRSLASVIADWRAGYTRLPPTRETRRTIEYLAHIHHWSGGYTQRPWQEGCQAILGTLREYLRRLGFSDPVPIIDVWASMVPPALGTVPGRDAHAENWLVTPGGAIVALDLEDHPRAPVLYEVVQLLEDHPLLPVDDQGWAERLKMCRLYLREWQETIGSPLNIADDEIPALYRLFAFVRAVFLCGHVPQKIRELESTGSLRFASSRLRHARELLTRLAIEEPNPRFRDAILQVLGRMPWQSV